MNNKLVISILDNLKAHGRPFTVNIINKNGSTVTLSGHEITGYDNFTITTAIRSNGTAIDIGSIASLTWVFCDGEPAPRRYHEDEISEFGEELGNKLGRIF